MAITDNKESCMATRSRWFIATLVTTLLGACALPNTNGVTGTAPSDQTGPTRSISDDAMVALAQAEADVARARAEFALWTTAELALKQARDAALTGDDVTVIRQARIATEMATLGLAQQHYPTTERLGPKP
jgi:hypothetical protein